MKIAVAGRETSAGNYVRCAAALGLETSVTLEPSEIADCDALILPGGGDITPAFFGECNRGSRDIDTELDSLQLQAFGLCLKARKPILGICKGMQIINVCLGGSIVQDLPTADFHRYQEGDQYHDTVVEKDSWLSRLCGLRAIVNSAHHQSIGRMGRGLRVIQRCPLDLCPEAIAHDSLPILGVQWHPERLDESRATLSGGDVLACLVSLTARRPRTGL